MCRFSRLAAIFAAIITIACLTGSASATTGSSAAATAVRLRLTGLNRDSRVVAVQEATLLRLANGYEYFYQGARLAVARGTYLIAAEVPTYSGTTLTSETLVFEKKTIDRSETIRLDGQDGKRLRVSLAGAQAATYGLSAGVCMALSPGGQGVLAGSAGGGPGVAVYAVPATSPYITFGYSDILTSAAGATYYLVGSRPGEIPRRLDYTQRASGLAKLTMALRSGAFGSSEFYWSIMSGNIQSFCGAGQNTNTFSVQSWVNYLTPGTWTTSVQAYSEGADGSFYGNASFYHQGTYRAGRSYANVFGGAVAGPGSDFPWTSAQYPSHYAQLYYSPELFDDPVMTGGQECCNRSLVTLRQGRHLLKSERIGANGVFNMAIRRSGWYVLDASGTRWFDGSTPANLLSRQVAVSFRFHASPRPAGNGSEQYLPLTDAQYQALGLNSANQAVAGTSTKVRVTITRPGDGGVASPVYRLTEVELFVSVNGGAHWTRLKLIRTGSYWQATIHDPSSGYVAIRSIVTDVHGDQTEQTVYRAYAVTG
jgi:hypothetical protein